MVDIYKSARCVNIWLGKISMVMSGAVDFMEALPDDPAEVPPLQVEVTPTKGNIATNAMGTITSGLKNVSLVTGALGDQWHWFNVIRIVARQWFQRAWTLQEFLVSSNFQIMMGDRDISPEAFVKAANQLIYFYTHDPFSTQLGLNVMMLSIRRFIEARARLLEERRQFQAGKRYRAEEYQNAIRVRRSTELKDKVVAGAALLEKPLSALLDYKMTTQEIYILFSVERLWPETGIFTLSLVGGVAAKVEGLPSWTPDYSTILRPQPLRYCARPNFETKVPGDGQTWKLQGKELHLSMAKFDVVKETGEGIWSWSQYSEDDYNSDNYSMHTSGSLQTERFGRSFPILNNLGVTYAPTEERTIDAFWQTIIGMQVKDPAERATWRDRFHQWFAFTLLSIRTTLRDERKDAENKFIPKAFKKKWLVPLIADWPNMEKRVTEFLDFHEQELEDADATGLGLRKAISTISKRLLGTETFEEAASWKSETAELLSAVRGEQFYGPISVFGQHFETVYDGRRIFTTEQGYMGVSAEAIRPGDVLALVAGGDVPYVFRPVRGKENTFSLIGEAYVHGIMSNGATLKAASDFSPVTIV